MSGTIYLLHIDPPYRHARHYLGWTEGNVEDRIARHINGQGSPLIRAAIDAGSKIELVRTWENMTRGDERRFKDSGSSTRLCPLCIPGYRARERERKNPEGKVLVRGKSGRWTSVVLN